MTDRQSQIDRDLERFYARNPAASKVAPMDSKQGISPLDMGTVSLDEIASAMEFPGAEEMDLQNELLPLLRKRLVWDIVPHTEQIQTWGTKMGVTPGSDEGDAVEEADSSFRRSLLIPMMPHVHLAAMEAGMVVSKTKQLAAEDSPEPDGTVLVISPEHDVSEEVASGTLAVIANLLELGILTYGKAITGE